MVDALAAHPASAVRSAERAGIDAAPEGALMARASARLAAVVVAHLRGGGGRVVGSRVVLLVGGGDNGGDALHCGALLARRGARVDALLVRDHAHEGGLAALRAAGGRRAGRLSNDEGTRLVPEVATLLAEADVVVDGILGTGGRPGLHGDAALLATVLRGDGGARQGDGAGQGIVGGDGGPGARGGHRPWVVAVDVPSGVDVGTGELPGTHLCADVTVTMGAAKPSLLLPPARWAAGEVVVVDLGLDGALLGAPSVTSFDHAAAGAAWPAASRGDDKYSRGVVGVVAGGDQYTGAAVLAVGGAVVSGAGMVRFLGAEHPTELVRQRWPEVVPGSGRVQAWVVGPGLDLDDPAAGDAAREALRAAVDDGVPLLLDSGALPLLTDHVAEHGPLDPGRSPVLLTPHAGELTSLLGSLPARHGGGDGAVERSDVQARPASLARAAARATGATVLLKGAATLLVPPRGAVTVQADGPPWLSTAGSGDVLAGVAGTLLAAGLPPVRAGALAALAHGAAGHRANPGGPVHAQDLLAALPTTIARLLAAGGRR